MLHWHHWVRIRVKIPELKNKITADIFSKVISHPGHPRSQVNQGTPKIIIVNAVFPLNWNPNIVGHHLSFNVHWKQVATHLRKETAPWRIWQAQPEDNKIKPFWWHTRQPVDRSQMTLSLSKVTSPATSHDNYIHYLFLIQKQSF